MKRILVLPGDGIGPEVTAVAVALLEKLRDRYRLAIELEFGAVGGAAVDQYGDPLPSQTLAKALAADAILFGAVGGPRWDRLERGLRPERGLLGLRSQLHLFCNLRPAVVYGPLAAASTLKPEVIRGLDVMIVRELTGDVYFGEPRGIAEGAAGRYGYNTMRYTEGEIERIADFAFRLARGRRKRLVSVDKANVLEVMELWRETVTRAAAHYPDVELSHMYVDNAAMQLVRKPLQFDVMLTSNMFGDILSDLASMLTGSIGMLPSASLDAAGKGMYEPIHGSAPDIAGQDKANPLAAVLSCAMLLRYSLHEASHAARVERAVAAVLESGLRTADIAQEGTRTVGTRAMGEAVIEALE
jgi:3-isopropylmalate dehydrogenase